MLGIVATRRGDAESAEAAFLAGAEYARGCGVIEEAAAGMGKPVRDFEELLGKRREWWFGGHLGESPMRCTANSVDPRSKFLLSNLGARARGPIPAGCGHNRQAPASTSAASFHLSPAWPLTLAKVTPGLSLTSFSPCFTRSRFLGSWEEEVGGQ